MLKYNTKNYFLILLAVIAVITVNSTKARDSNKQESSNKPEDNTDFPGDEIEQDEMSTITTRIYKSSDPSFELLQNDYDIDQSFDSDIIRKEELIGKSHGRTTYSIKHSKVNNVNNIFLSKYKIFFPFIVFLFIASLLAFVFRFLGSKKF